MVSSGRFELPLPFGNQGLSLTRLPVPPGRHMERKTGFEPVSTEVAARRDRPATPLARLAEGVGLEPTRPEGPTGIANRPLANLSILPKWCAREDSNPQLSG